MATDPSTIELMKTCDACPEQYDAFIGDRMVGYLRLRHGTFRVDYPDAGGETLFTAHPIGDGIFDDDEREFYLEAARIAIAARIDGTAVGDEPLSGIETWRSMVAAGQTMLGYGEWVAEKRYSKLRNGAA